MCCRDIQWRFGARLPTVLGKRSEAKPIVGLGEHARNGSLAKCCQTVGLNGVSDQQGELGAALASCKLWKPAFGEVPRLNLRRAAPAVG